MLKANQICKMASLKTHHVLKILPQITIKINDFLIIALLCNHTTFMKLDMLGL